MSDKKKLYGLAIEVAMSNVLCCVSCYVERVVLRHQTAEVRVSWLDG